MSEQRRICATMSHHFHLAATDPAYRDRRRRIETFTHASRLAPRTRVVTIAVVVHVLHRNDSEDLPDAQVHSQLDVLNRDFRRRNTDVGQVPAPFGPDVGDALVEFALAQRDPGGLPTTGIVRHRSPSPAFPYRPESDATAELDALIKFAPSGSPAWPREDYLNLWVCPLDGGLLGYAQFPGGARATDGVVIHSGAFGTVGELLENYALGRTCVHEVGHWLNLLHIWGDDGDACNRSDTIVDTPNQGGPNHGVPMFPTTSCGNAPHGDMFMNYMDYVDDGAMQMFSRGQVERMNATLAGPRASLAVSNGLLPVPPASGSQAAAREYQLSLAPRQKQFDGVDWV